MTLLRLHLSGGGPAPQGLRCEGSRTGRAGKRQRILTPASPPPLRHVASTSALRCGGTTRSLGEGGTRTRRPRRSSPTPCSARCGAGPWLNRVFGCHAQLPCHAWGDVLEDPLPFAESAFEADRLAGSIATSPWGVNARERRQIRRRKTSNRAQSRPRVPASRAAWMARAAARITSRSPTPACSATWRQDSYSGSATQSSPRRASLISIAP